MPKSSKICIYCLKDEQEVAFTKAEHVVPQSFGKFENNLTLNGCVCDSCNQFFGDNLELLFARDSIEGTHRYRFGQKPPKDYQPRKDPRVRYEIQEGPNTGFPAWVNFDGSTTPNVTLKPGFRVSGVNGEDPKFYAPDELPTAKDLLASMGVKKADFQIKVVEIEFEKAQRLLEKKGYKNTRWEGPEYPELGPIYTETIAKVDALTFRTVAKVVFNYMTHQHGAAFALLPSFNGMRSYIRWETELPERSTWMDQKPIVMDKEFEGQLVGGHFVTLHWHYPSGRLMGQVSFYNQFRYTIALTPTTQPLSIIPESSGHFFNIVEKKIFPMMHKMRLVAS